VSALVGVKKPLRIAQFSMHRGQRMLSSIFMMTSSSGTYHAFSPYIHSLLLYSVMRTWSAEGVGWRRVRFVICCFQGYGALE
jgi:hypothetical protein